MVNLIIPLSIILLRCAIVSALRPFSTSTPSLSSTKNKNIFFTRAKTASNNTSSNNVDTAESSSALETRTSKVLGKSRWFQRVVQLTFQKMDRDGSGFIDQNEFYTGLLEIHLRLASFCGPAACKAIPEDTVNKLFSVVDNNYDKKRSDGKIDSTEFAFLMNLCSSQMFLRILIQWIFTIILIPILTDFLVMKVGILGISKDFMDQKRIILYSGIIVSVVLSVIITPICLNLIDHFFLSYFSFQTKVQNIFHNKYGKESLV